MKEKDSLTEQNYHAVLQGLGNASKISAASLLEHFVKWRTKWRKEEASKGIDIRKRVKSLSLASDTQPIIFSKLAQCFGARVLGHETVMILSFQAEYYPFILSKPDE